MGCTSVELGGHTRSTSTLGTTGKVLCLAKAVELRATAVRFFTPSVPFLHVYKSWAVYPAGQFWAQ